MREYEVMLIVDPEADDVRVEAAVERVSRVLAERGGEVRSVDRWGRRRLAYEIRRRGEGIYVVIQITADPDTVEEIDRVLALADEVMRHKVVRRAA